MTASAPPLQDRVVALFGGGGRLAPFLTRRLLDTGAEVALVDASADGLARVTGQLADAARVAAYTADVTDEAAVSAALQALLARFGRLDRFVWAVNAALPGSLDSMPVESWRRTLEVHLTGYFLCLRAALEPLRRAGGAVVNIASVYGVVSPDPRTYADPAQGTPLAYAAAKGGLIAMTRYLAVYLAPWNIRVNSVSPGGIAAGQEPAFLARYAERVPQRRMADPLEVADAVVFLLGDASGHVTGQNLIVDGGLTAW